jgi:hypothetical protein
MSFWSHLLEDDPFLFQGPHTFAAMEARVVSFLHAEPEQSSTAPFSVPAVATGAGPLAQSLAEPVDTSAIEAAPHAFTNDHFMLTISTEGDLVAPGPDFISNMPAFGPALFHGGGDLLFG